MTDLPKLFPATAKKTNTTPQLYGTLSTYLVCKTKTNFPPEQKTDTTAQLEKMPEFPA